MLHALTFGHVQHGGTLLGFELAPYLDDDEDVPNFNALSLYLIIASVPSTTRYVTSSSSESMVHNSDEMRQFAVLLA